MLWIPACAGVTYELHVWLMNSQASGIRSH